jgi:hypothetical protein
VSVPDTVTSLNNKAYAKSVHRTIESVYIKGENIQLESNKEVSCQQIFLKLNFYKSKREVLYNKCL